jgi:hypothetical protein
LNRPSRSSNAIIVVICGAIGLAVGIIVAALLAADASHRPVAVAPVNHPAGLGPRPIRTIEMSKHQDAAPAQVEPKSAPARVEPIAAPIAAPIAPPAADLLRADAAEWARASAKDRPDKAREDICARYHMRRVDYVRNGRQYWHCAR